MRVWWIALRVFAAFAIAAVGGCGGESCSPCPPGARPSDPSVSCSLCVATDGGRDALGEAGRGDADDVVDAPSGQGDGEPIDQSPDEAAAPDPAVGACSEFYSAYFGIRTADGRATIARAEVTNCLASADPCWPRPADLDAGTGDAGAPVVCSKIEAQYSSIAGITSPCTVVLTSIAGQVVTVSANLVDDPPVSQCRIYTGQIVDEPRPRYDPADVVIDFAAGDGGRAAD